jgi:universal stress protein A
MTFKKIVYPAGFEEDGSDPAFAMAAKLARESRGVLYLIHVLPLPTPMTFPAEGVLLADRDRAEAMLQKLALKVPVGVERKLIIKFGHTAPEIAKAGRAVGAEVIVMGTHRRTGLSHLLLGSVAERVVQLASCPVITLPLNATDEVHDTASQAA